MLKRKPTNKQERGNRPNRRRGGTAMLETAITLPVTLIVLFGTLEFGLVFSRYQVILGATAQAARIGSLFRPLCNPGVVEVEMRDTLQAYGNPLNMDLADPIETELVIDGLCEPSKFLTVDVTFRHRFEAIDGLVGYFGSSLPAVIPLHARVRVRNET